jgi:glycosyltransferase involved in cell wall biosynthesis
MAKLSIIVSTYNAPRQLGLVLDGLSRQHDSEFECLVADDGSGPETCAVVASFRERLSIIHSWQEDAGFRLAGVRNRALALASGEIIAFLDGDCIPTPHYVGDVRRLMNRGDRIYLQGHRLLLDRELSASLTSTEGIFDPGWVLRHRRHLGNIKNALRFPWPLFRTRRLHGVRGCNMIFRRADLVAVNGFDESFVGWGHEDRDIVSRLFQIGVHRADARGRAVVYHLWHPEQDRTKAKDNLRRAEEARPPRATSGLRRS